MKRHFENLTNKASRAVQHWWFLMLAGVLCIAAGIAVFAFPLASYVTLSILTGIVMLLVGAAQLTIASTSGNYITMRGYMIAGGVVDILLGIFLCVYPGVTLALLPILMGLWMMYNAFMIIAFGGDLEVFRIKGSGWATTGGIILLILSILVLLNPFSVGVATVIIIAGFGLLVLGFLICWMSLLLRNIDKILSKEYPA